MALEASFPTLKPLISLSFFLSGFTGDLLRVSEGESMPFMTGSTAVGREAGRKAVGR